jgi:hypothetical protein
MKHIYIDCLGVEHEILISSPPKKNILPKLKFPSIRVLKKMAKEMEKSIKFNNLKRR